MSMPKRSPAFALVLSASLALFGCAAESEPVKTATASAAVTPSTPAAQSAPPSAAIERDPTLAATLEPLIVGDLPPLSLVASDNIAADCGVDAGGCYSADDATIYVTSEWTDFRVPELLAHEYLHYVWDRDALAGDAELTSALDAAYADDEGLGALVPMWHEQEYVEDDGSIASTELFSYVCTGLRPDQVAAVIAARCAQSLNVDALPIGQHISASALTEEITRARQAEGLASLEQNPYAAAASEARADLFTPESQVPLSEYPDSVREQLDAGCTPSKYGAFLTRPYDPAKLVADIDDLLDGALTSSDYTGVGIAITEFDHIDARALFGERTIRVNATLIVTTVCE